MEIPIEINSSVIEWLSSMGYPVAGMPRELMRTILIREARQWQMSPSRLAAWINEGVRQPVTAGAESRLVARESQPQRLSTTLVGAHG